MSEHEFHRPRVFGPGDRIWSYVEVDTTAEPNACHNVWLTIMDRDVAVMRYRIPYVVAIKYEASVDMGPPRITLTLERTRSKMRAVIDSSSVNLGDLLTEIVAGKLNADDG